MYNAALVFIFSVFVFLMLMFDTFMAGMKP